MRAGVYKIIAMIQNRDSKSWTRRQGRRPTGLGNFSVNSDTIIEIQEKLNIPKQKREL